MCGFDEWEVIDDEPEDKAFWVRITNKGRCLGTNWHTTRTDEAYFVKPYTLDKYVVVDDPCHQSKFIYHDDCERIKDLCETHPACPECVAKAQEILNSKDREARSTALINKVYEQMADKDRKLALKGERIQSLLEEKGVLETSLEAKSRHIERLQWDLADKIQICKHLGKRVDCLEKQSQRKNCSLKSCEVRIGLQSEKIEDLEVRNSKTMDALKSVESRLHIKIMCLEGMEANRDQFAADLAEARAEIKTLEAGTFKLELDPASAGEFFKRFPKFKPKKKAKK